jgi:predicted DNA-binding transcriptional regulator YafY
MAEEKHMKQQWPLDVTVSFDPYFGEPSRDGEQGAEVLPDGKVHFRITAKDAKEVVIDRFGTDVKVVENRETEFIIEVEIAVNHVFYSWVFGFGGKVRIEGPNHVRESYHHMVRNVAEGSR